MSVPPDTLWRPIEVVPYGAVLHVPADWEALPPVPANGPEILRATGGPGRNLILFKVPARGMTVAQVADTAQERLSAHGYDGFARFEARFAGRSGLVLEFATKTVRDVVIHRTREYFAVRGNAAFVLGMGSASWDEHLPLIEEIAARFELVG